ncbi:MAG: septal ring lytic transglycosylase RlpA family protein [Candidatus Omnitrophica bacterium]|nr:septal ring lytic transglycosylase RlpA family protein [Candidatus Omnitrophota bacterium]
MDKIKLSISILLIVAVASSLGFAEIFETGIASYYSYECAKSPMANGKPFDPEKRTCASWFYDFGTVLSVQSLDTGRSTYVVVTDRGPNKRLVKKGRVIDLSKRAFEDICDLKKGFTRVIITVKTRL